MSQKTITVPDEVYERVQREAESAGKTVDDMAAEYLQKELGRAAMERLSRRAAIRRGDKTEEECDEIIALAVKKNRESRRSL